jgi:hypothetical protein
VKDDHSGSSSVVRSIKSITGWINKKISFGKGSNDIK